MESLGLILFFCLAFDCSNQDEVVTLEENIKTHLNEDPITKQLLAGIYGQEDFVTPQFKTLLHLSLNNLLISNEIYASTDTDGSLGLPQAGDNVQQENEMLLNCNAVLHTINNTDPCNILKYSFKHNEHI